MTSFEFLFSLYGLLLGFSLVAVLGGIARTVEAWANPAPSEAGHRRGYLLPLLAVFVLLDLLSFWSAAWASREVLAVSGRSLISVMFFASAYYVAAYLVFPDRVKDYRNLDGHYFKVRRIVLGILLALLFLQLLFYSLTPAIGASLQRPAALLFTAVLVLLMILGMVSRSVAFNTVVMGLLIARYLFAYLR
jgi:hypothetical protein